MKTKLVRIGNSVGIRIPKHLIEEARLEGDLELHVRGEALILQRRRTPRATWSDRFREMAERGDDAILDDSTPTAWDDSEWEWK